MLERINLEDAIIMYFVELVGYLEYEKNLFLAVTFCRFIRIYSVSNENR